MPAKYRFVVNGNFVELYDDAMLALTVRNTSIDVDWFYDDSTSMMFEIDTKRYFPTSPSQIEVDGVTLTAYSEFDAAIKAIFTNLDSPTGGGATIYTSNGTLNGNRTVDLDGHDLSFINGRDMAYNAASHTFVANTGPLTFSGGIVPDGEIQGHFRMGQDFTIKIKRPNGTAWSLTVTDAGVLEVVNDD